MCSGIGLDNADGDGVLEKEFQDGEGIIFHHVAGASGVGEGIDVVLEVADGDVSGSHFPVGVSFDAVLDDGVVLGEGGRSDFFCLDLMEP